MTSITKEIIQKYDIPGPRYTSYPTAPEWDNQINSENYIDKLKELGATDKTLSLYVHIPFCESMCYFCACNVIIRKKEEKYGDEYLNHLFTEIDLVRKYIGKTMTIRQLHWGGGTPTFLSELQLERLFQKISQNFRIDPEGEIAIEIEPRRITQSKIKKLKQLGFNRISMGIQDFDPQVQKDINRLQPFETVQQVCRWCREENFHSINFDLIYGLPFQTPETFQETLKKVFSLRPDRIALYSFAHVPWLKKHQSKLNSAQMPSADDKLDIFLNARKNFLDQGYQSIAMDHFALKNDELAHAFNHGQLYRNFMGYTVKPADEYVGLGITSIGFLQNAFIQNFKTIGQYYRSLDQGWLPVERGKILSDDDSKRQWIIMSLMCRFKIDKDQFERKFKISFDSYFQEEMKHLEHCRKEGLIIVQDRCYAVTDLGKIFIRNICMGFDWYLRQKSAHRRFSRTI